jgi:HK97 family phage major capsid protein
MPSAKRNKLTDRSAIVMAELDEKRAYELSDEQVEETVAVAEQIAALSSELNGLTEQIQAEDAVEEVVRAAKAAIVTRTVSSDSDSRSLVESSRKGPAIHILGNMRGFKNSADAVKGGQFLRALGLGRFDEARAMGETLGSGNYDGKGAELVSPELYRGFIDVLSYASVGVQVATLFQTDANSFEIPKIGEIEADWVDELEDADDDEYATSKETVQLYKAGRIVEVSNELLSDSGAVVNLATLFTSRIGLALAKKIDDVWLNGDETKDIDGLVDLVSEGNTVEAGEDHDGIDLAELVGKIDNRASNTAWVVSSEGFSHIMKASVVTQSTTIGDRVLPVVMGAPVYRVLSLPAGTIALYGDFSMSTAVVTHRNGLQVAASEHAGFMRDSILFRGLQRFGLVNHDPQFVAKLTTAS